MHPLTPDFAITPVSAGRPHFAYVPDGEMRPPVVSVVIPYYNTGEVFLETAQSVWQQSLQQWEMLIVNDGSDDGKALQILDEFRGKDRRIRVIDLNENRGLPAARNEGWQQGQADLVYLLDSDDLIEPTALEKMAWCLDSYPEYSFCKGFTVWFGARELMNASRFEDGDLFLQRNIVTILAMVRRDVVQSVGGFDESLVAGLEDWDFWLHCASQGHWGHTIPEPFDWFRRRQQHSDRWTAWTDRGVQEMRRKLKERYPSVFAQGIPLATPGPPEAYGIIRDDLPFTNPLLKERTRVLLVLPWMAMGGADKFNLDLVRLLQKRGYEFSIATTLPNNYPWYREFAKLTPDIFILPNFLRKSDYARFLYYLIRSRQIDVVVVSNSELGYKLLPYLRSRCPDTTFVDYSHMEEESWNSGGHPRSAVGYQELLDLNMVASGHLKEWMVERGAEPDRIEVCTVNVDTQQFWPDDALRQKMRSALRIRPTTTTILYAGRLTEQKQPRVFAEVMRELKARRLDFACLVAGDGEDRNWLSRYLRKHRLTRYVWLMGAVSHEKMRELYAASDILFMPSKMEGIAITIYEAMAMGLAVVGADVGGQKELVPPECGILLVPGTKEEQVATYADALEQLIRSAELRRSLGKAGQARVRAHFDIEQMGNRMDMLLQRAQGLHRSQPRVDVGPGLGLEHTVQSLEYERLGQWAGKLSKYQQIERALEGFRSRLSPWTERVRRYIVRPARIVFTSYVSVPARKVKDAVWIAGHKVKVRLLSIEEAE